MSFTPTRAACSAAVMIGARCTSRRQLASWMAAAAGIANGRSFGGGSDRAARRAIPRGSSMAPASHASRGGASRVVRGAATAIPPATAAARGAAASPPPPRRVRERSVLRAEPVPAVEVDALRDQLLTARARQPGEHRLERLLLGDPGIERVLAAQAGRDLERLAPVLTQLAERVDQEVLVGDRRADLQRRVPGGEHRQVMLVEVVDRLGVV